MKCPVCGQLETRVVDSRPAEAGAALRRRRQCAACDGRFTTLERVLKAPLYIHKKDGRREEFDADKLRGGVLKACNKRPVSLHEIDVLVSEVEASLRQDSRSEAEAEAGEIGDLVMERLYHLDQVAYVRFASVYQQFDDVKLFAELLERMTRGGRRARRVPEPDAGTSTETAAPEEPAST
jgi:transcriptional repressor NrdR